MNTSEFESIQPHSRESEEALIGSVLLNPSSIYELPTDAKEFYIHRHQYIWEAYRTLQDKHIAIDYVTVMEELERTNKLEAVGGAVGLTNMINKVPSSLHALEYAAVIRDKFIRRQTIALSTQLAQAAYNDEENIIVKRSDIAQELTEVQGASGAVHIKEWMSSLYDRVMEWQANPSATAGLATGYADLDKVLGDGLMTGVNLLGGKPGMGKSILAQNVAENFTMKNIPGVLYSAEMTWVDFSLRVLSRQTDVTVSTIRRGMIPDKKMGSIMDGFEEISKRPFFVLDPKGMTTAELRADLVRLKAQHDIRWMVFDYLELLGDEYPRLKDWERSARLARKMVLIATALDLPCLVVQKLNKSGWDVSPKLEDFAGGSDLAYDVVNALVLCEHIPQNGGESDGNMRTIVNVKPQRLVEQTKKACNLYKLPLIPKFEAAVIRTGGEEYRDYAR